MNPPCPVCGKEGIVSHPDGDHFHCSHSDCEVVLYWEGDKE